MPISRENVGQLSQKYSERYYLMDRVIWCIKNIPNFDETVQKITISENVRKGVDAPTHASRHASRMTVKVYTTNKTVY